MQERLLGFQERIIFSLRELYDGYGYCQYKMSKFEEYDLYARNKDFLICDSVITFMDLNGKLMALKPDVTLSIVKNTVDTPDTVQKLYYNENIYRVAKGAKSFREMMQVGLECLGDVDDYCIREVLALAAKSLNCISAENVLSVSHLGLIWDIFDTMGVPNSCREALIQAIGDRNAAALEQICTNAAVADSDISLLKKIVNIKGALFSSVKQVQTLLAGRMDSPALIQLSKIAQSMDESLGLVQLDFSVVDNLHYYNGIVFKGYISGVPTSVLSGGQYDKLMQKMGRKASAVGFAVYMDAVEYLQQSSGRNVVDTILLYDANEDLPNVEKQAQILRSAGKRVLVQKTIPANVQYRNLLKISGSEVKTVEDDA